MTTQTKWTPEAIKQANDELEGKSPRMIMRWALETFAPSITLATGFGPSGIVLMFLVSQLRPETPVFYLDTDLLFKQTYALRNEFEQRFGIRFERVHSGISLKEQAAQHGDALWSHNSDACCNIRKVIPQREYLKNYDAWITGVRRDQTAFRSNANIVEWDKANEMVKINPLVAWTEQEVWDCIRAHELPYNPLHDDGYPSIGCWTCTQAVAPGEDPRSGRWAGMEKTECGMHLEK